MTYIDAPMPPPSDEPAPAALTITVRQTPGHRAKHGPLDVHSGCRLTRKQDMAPCTCPCHHGEGTAL